MHSCTPSLHCHTQSKYTDIVAYVYSNGNPVKYVDPDRMIDYDIDGMDDTKWHGFNVDEDMIVLNEYIHDYSYDQRYGQTVTGGIGTGSQTTSGLHGQSIDASDLGYSFDGWGSRGTEFFYNLIKRVQSLYESFYQESTEINMENNWSGANNLRQKSVITDKRRIYLLSPKVSKTTIYPSGATSTTTLQWDTTGYDDVTTTYDNHYNRISSDTVKIRRKKNNQAR